MTEYSYCCFEVRYSIARMTGGKGTDYIDYLTSTLKAEAVSSSEMLITTYQTIWCHKPEDCSINYCFHVGHTTAFIR
jgi:hypothetical protein